jgi:hypothetical protein
MAVQVKYLYDSIPNSFTVEYLGNRHTFYVGGGRSVELVNDLSEIVYIVHAAASSMSPTLTSYP